MAEEPRKVMAWLAAKPDLETMRARFPDDWKHVEAEVADALATQSTVRLDALLMREGSRGPEVGRRPSQTGKRARLSAVTGLVRRRMAILALEHVSLVAATGAGKGKAPIGRPTLAIASGLFLDRDGFKKPASRLLSRLVWPLVPEKAAYLTRMQSEGTYCLLSDDLIAALATLIGDRRCLEIAAGDGTLSRFLSARGTHINATDDMSWSHEIAYPPSVASMAAVEALQTHRPAVVVCSWPPPGNTFKRAVFETASVETYVVIASRHRFAAGAWQDYEAQTGFDMRSDPASSGSSCLRRRGRR